MKDWSNVKVSELAQEVLDVVIWAEQQPGVTVHMCEWITSTQKGECSLCAAGAYWYKNYFNKVQKVLSFCNEVRPEHMQFDIPEDISQSMDCLQKGLAESAAYTLGYDAYLYLYNVYDDGFLIVSYSTNPVLWKDDMRSMIRALELRGL